MKKCTMCEQVKGYSEFYRKSAGSDGYKNQCKDCIRSKNRANYHINREERLSKQRASQRLYTAKKFGLTEDTFKSMYHRAGGCCEICGITEEENGKYLAIDHCHTTVVVRGLLCHSCNVGLGNFKDNQELLRKAMGYLDGYCLGLRS